MQSSSPPRARSSRRNWVGFFVLLALLASFAAALPVVFNLRQQVRLEQLEAARARWREHGPRDYDLEYTVRHDRDPVPERFLVLVRDGQPVLGAREGEIVYLSPLARMAIGGLGAAFDNDPGADVETVFGRIQQVLWQEEESGRRNYVTAIFDDQDGHPKRFVYRVRGTSQREEWHLLLSPPGEAGRRGKMVR
jgi:hypothetical protein